MIYQLHINDISIDNISYAVLRSAPLELQVANRRTIACPILGPRSRGPGRSLSLRCGEIRAKIRGKKHLKCLKSWGNPAETLEMIIIT